MRELGDALCSRELQPPVRALIVYGANPAISMPNQARTREGLLRDDLFTVVHELFVTETARYADYVLPATSQIEHLDLTPAWGHLYLALNRPAIAPLGESVCNTELFRRLAGALGRTEPWLFESDESMLRAALGSGHPWLDGITYERLWTEGYVRLNCPEDWRPFADGGFATASGKAELYSEPLRELGHDPLPWAGEIRGGEGLQLISGKALHFLNSGYANMERHRRRAGELYVEVHPDDARARRLTDGETVRVWNERGEVRAVCSVSDRVRPGVVWMPFGGFADAGGVRRSINILTPVEPTDWGGGSGFSDAFVEDRAGAGVTIKPIPPATPQHVLPPNLDHEYFKDGARHPFRHDAGGFELVNAWWLAEAALLTYAPVEFASQQFRNAGWTVDDDQPFSGASTLCYVAHSPMRSSSRSAGRACSSQAGAVARPRCVRWSPTSPPTAASP